MQHRLHPLALATLTVIAVAPLAGCHQETAAAAVSIPSVPYAVAEPATMTNDLVLSAEFRPYQDVDVMAKVAGYIRNIRVDIGDHVRQGDLLATLEVPELQDEMAKAGAGLAGSEANIVTAAAAVRRAEAGANIAHLSYQRIQDVQVKEPGLVPRQEVDVAQSHDLEAAAQLASAQSALRSAGQMRLQAESERSRAGAMLQYTSIRAPFTGVITRRYASTGSMIQAGISSSTQAMPVVRVAQNDLLRLILPVPVTAVSGIHKGQAVDVNVVTLGKTIPGTVTRYADSLQSATRTMDTEVDVPNPDGALVPGMYAEVHLHLADRPNVLSVPVDAVDGMGSNTQHAFVIRADGLVHQVTITTGLQTPTRVEILSGLSAGDRVIVGRHSGLAEGEKVDARPASYEANGSSHS